MEKSLKQQQQPARMMKKRQEHKSGKVDRRKSLRSVGSFMSRVLKTLGTLAHLGEADGAEAEDDDGGFRKSGGGGGSGGVPSGKQPGEPPPAHGVRQSLSGSGSVKERLSWCYGERTPGVLGLKNHGNTCFMNAVVQCLSNTDLLAEYLGLEQYRANGLAQPRRGEVTEQLATLVRGLWTLEYTPQLSVEFKSIVSKYGAQFRGNSQHDALEFLLWLLDRMHEDVSPSPSSLSSKTKAPGKGTSGTEGTSNTHPQQPGGRHSFVQDHFQAQYRSSLTCPHCFKQSNTFDPFLCISLPIPLRQTRPIFITLVFSTKGQRYLRVGLAVPLFGTVAILRDMVADEGKVSPEQVILTEVYSAGFQRSFFDDEDLTNIAESDVIYAFQAPPLYGRGGSMRNSGYHHSLPSSPYFSGPEGQRMSDSGTLSSEFLNHGGSSKILLLICNTSGPAQQVARFGPPFLMREDRTISWDQLQQSILSKLYYLMIDRAQTQSMERVPFKIRVVGGSTSYSYLSPQDGRPLCHPAVDRALKFCAAGGPPHVKLHVEWEPKIKDSLFGNIQEEVVKDAESVRTQQQQHLQQHSCTLDECFQLYTKEEQLAPDDAWKCPHCKQLQQGMVKMSLWTLPDILILHLKRFRQVGERRNKLSTLVRFPLASLDMAPHVVKRSQSSRSLGPWSAGWKQPYPPDTGPPPEFLYDLYAVCNHHGGMHGGHYTAYCRNSVDGQWYSYDDSSVDLTPEEEICTRGAYILFYQRRNVIPPWSASSSVRGSTSSSASDHWLLRLAGDSKRGSMVSRASTNCPSSLPESPGIPESPVFSEEPLKEERGGFESRPFVRGIQGRSVSMRTPTKTRESLAKVLPLRWSFGSRERHKRPPGELVEYLESGRRPRCTKDPIAALMEKEPSTTRRQEAFTSPSLGGLSCLGRVSDEQLDCDRVPQGQQRPGLEKTRRGSSKSKQEQGKSQESQSHRNSSVGNPNLESTLKRGKGASGGQGDHASQPEESKVKKPLELGGPEGLLAFLKSSFMKKDSQKKPRESVTVQEGISPRQDSSRLSLNGAAEAKVNGAPRSKRSEKPLANGRVQRSQSSSNLPNRSDGTLRRSTSLHKNGTPGPPRSLTAEKPSSASLQRSRYSTASLGRKRTVPESSF